MTETRELEIKLDRLRQEHRELDTLIAELIDKNIADQLQLQRFKKRKLCLKDEIIKIEGLLVPDIIA